MKLEELFDIALPVVYILVGIALIAFLIELVRFLSSTRKTVTALKEELDPTLEHVEKITAALEPVIPKVDPLVDRVSLTVDAANLEIMRVDQILENMTDITTSVSSATAAVDTAANAPLNLVNNASSKLRELFKGRKASDESVALGSGEAPMRAALESAEEPRIAESCVAASCDGRAADDDLEQLEEPFVARAYVQVNEKN